MSRYRNLKNFNKKGTLTLFAKKYGGLSLKKGEGRVRAERGFYG